MLIRTLSEHFVNLLQTGIAGLRLVELDWGQLELTGSVLTDPAALVSLDKLQFRKDGDGRLYDFELSIKICWMRMDRLSATNPMLDTRLANLDLLDETRHLLEGYRSGNLVRSLEVKQLGLANDQQTNYKQFHKSYECFVLLLAGTGWEEEQKDTIVLGSLGDVFSRVKFKEIKS